MAMEAEKGGIISIAPLLVDAAELPSKGQGKLRISGLQFFWDEQRGKGNTANQAGLII